MLSHIFFNQTNIIKKKGESKYFTANQQFTAKKLM